MGRFLPFSAALRQHTMMLQCMELESANTRHTPTYSRTAGTDPYRKLLFNGITYERLF